MGIVTIESCCLLSYFFGACFRACQLLPQKNSLIMTIFLPWSVRCFLSSVTFFNCSLFATYHAYKSLSRKHQKETTRWLLFWSVIGIFLLLEQFFEFFLYNVLPLYPEFKICFLLLLVISPNAPKTLLREYLVPLLRHYGIDQKMQVALSGITTYLLKMLAFFHFGMINRCMEFSIVDPFYLNEFRSEMDTFAMQLAHKIPKEAKRTSSRKTQPVVLMH